MEKIKVGIIGAAGYTAGELIRILLHHDFVDLVSLVSESQSETPISDVHKDLVGLTNLNFSRTLDPSAELIFLCKGHGESSKILALNPEYLMKKIIDLSQDFRLDGSHDFIYGLPEFYSSQIKKAQHIANPGCFATSIQLGILPALKANAILGEIHISGITGSTGAGQSLSSTSHFTWRHSNASVYKPLNHQHLTEVGEQAKIQSPSFDNRINFIPYRGAFTRGIITTSYFDTELSDEALKSIYFDAYKNAAFTTVIDTNPDLKLVVNTNRAMIYPCVIGGQAVVISIIDNLLKGASGQAIQNMNLICGFEEKIGLNLKPSIF
ncbi:MAG: N-acetyl-gamma-glutamyl-phosphate reductase [Cyclobacteriaceae bacterium]